MHLTEDILHFIWKNGLFDQNDLMTTEGNKIEIVKNGIHNHHSGPDFNDARIKIGVTLWVGQLEIHIHSSDWYQHKHQNDRTYDNVILHVVYEHDKDVMINDKPVPTFELRNRIKPSLFRKYKELSLKEAEIPCCDYIAKIKRPIIISQIETSLVERLERKSEKVLKVLAESKNDWEETVFRLLAFQLVGKINEQPMEWLMNEVSLKMLRSSGNNIFEKEAFLLGTAGMLEISPDEYSQKLNAEFQHQKTKFNLTELNPVIWRYGRMRPAQFPSLSLVQLAAIINRNDFLFASLIENDVKGIIEFFLDVTASDYWKSHHQIGKTIENRSVNLGEMQRDLILINVLAPVLFAYGSFMDEERFKIKASEILLEIKAEKNNILRKWEKSGIKPTSAFDSQGMIELYNNSCIRKKCLTCRIGTNWLKNDSEN